MKARSVLGILILVLSLGAAGNALAGLPGDVTGNGAVDVSDIQCTVLTALNPQPPACLAAPTAADLNCSGATDVVDIQLEVLIVLYYPNPGLPADKDANKNNIVDACEGAPPVCGNGKCEPPTESNANCPADCPASAYKAGDVIITEIMKDPKMIVDTSAEWFEIRNMTAAAINLNGWIIADKGTDKHTINNGGPLNLDSAKNMVLGINKDKATNGNVTVAYQYAGITLDNGADAIILKASDGTMIDTVAYDDGVTFPDVPGRSLSLNTTAMDHLKNDDGKSWCVATLQMSNGDYGSPGVVNPNCPPPAVCGNMAVEQGEQCDPPTPGTCDAQCQLIVAICGDKVVEGMEQCDDGCLKGVPGVCEMGVDDGDGCTALCLLESPKCGNNIVDPGEDCDPPNPSKGCGPDCKKLNVCGNGVVEPGEDCDPPNPANKCDANCKVIMDPLCGNGIKEGTEECDDGCLDNIPNVCEAGPDDPDPANPNDPDTCYYDCSSKGGGGFWCGNGVVEPQNMETCDPPGMPNAKGEFCADYCKIVEPSWCCNPSPCCCDGNKDNGEECDDGNKVDGDGCSSKCVAEAPPVTTGFSGTISYSGTVAPADALTIMYFKQAVPNCKQPPGAPAGGQIFKNLKMPFDYAVDTKAAGTYYVSATYDVGGNNPQGPGPEDSCAVYNGSVVVQTSKVTPGINITIPPASAAKGSIEGTITFTGQVTAQDSLHIILSSSKPPQITPVGMPTKIKPVTFPYAYKISAVADGKYYVVGMFDKSDDSTQGPKAGDWMGAYPTYASPTQVTVSGAAVKNISFTLTQSQQ